MSVIDKIIEEEYIPHMVNEIFPKVKKEIHNSDEDFIIDLFIEFERMCKMKREQLMMLETKNNSN